jgi:hypothetical protein
MKRNMRHIKSFEEYMNKINEEEGNNSVRETQIGDLPATIITEYSEEGEPGDTTIEIKEAGVLCTVSGEEADQFIQELNELIGSYRI